MFHVHRLIMTKPKASFSVGSIVAERNKNIAIDSKKPESMKIISQNRSTRRGEIVKTDIQINARGQKRTYHWVLWEGSKSPSLHEQSRLCLADQADEVLSAYRESFN